SVTKPISMTWHTKRANVFIASWRNEPSLLHVYARIKLSQYKPPLLFDAHWDQRDPPFHKPSLANRLSTIPALPFRRGEGGGEGFLSAESSGVQYSNPQRASCPS